ncbi:MAG: hypothetical protein M3Z24_14030, partial [Chloroflexota bacterium]|nr:hypothetical protein [Chloroflexota bacterium]
PTATPSPTPTTTTTPTPSPTPTITVTATPTPSPTITPTTTTTPTPSPTTTPSPTITPTTTTTPSPTTPPTATATPTTTSTPPTVTATTGLSSGLGTTATPNSTPASTDTPTPSPTTSSATGTPIASTAIGEQQASQPIDQQNNDSSSPSINLLIIILASFGVLAALVGSWFFLHRRLNTGIPVPGANLPPSGARPWSRTRDANMSLDGNTNLYYGSTGANAPFSAGNVPQPFAPPPPQSEYPPFSAQGPSEYAQYGQLEAPFATNPVLPPVTSQFLPANGGFADPHTDRPFAHNDATLATDMEQSKNSMPYKRGGIHLHPLSDSDSPPTSQEV